MNKEQVEYLKKKFPVLMKECTVMEEVDIECNSTGVLFIYHTKNGISSRFDTVDSFVKFAKPVIPDEPKKNEEVTHK
ncbi:MAG: hypothetical protein IT569_07455 [Leptospiraceae bacterium]|nr:hypothetical protein [Leptospiraceae bacterium]